MNQLEKIRKTIEQNKKALIKRHNPIGQSCFNSLFYQYGVITAIQSERNMNIFPMLSFASNSVSKQNQDKFENCGFLVNKQMQLHNNKKEKKLQVVSLQQDARRKNKFSLEPAKNLRELMTRSMAPSVRINKASPLIKRDFFRTQRSCQIKKKAGNSVIIVTKSKMQADLDKIAAISFKKNSYLVRRIKSPIKKMSPQRKFSISAWETSDDLQL